MARVSRIRASRLARRPAAIMGGLLLLTFGFGAPSMAQTGTHHPDTAAWARCQEALTRRCVLRRALEVATTRKEGGADPLTLFFIAAAQADAGLAQDASATVDLLGPWASGAVSDEVAIVVDRIKAIVAQTEADAGKLEEAMSTASVIKDLAARATTIGLVVVAEGKAGSIDNALKRVQAVQDDKERAIAIRTAAWGLRFIATQREEDGKIAEALRQHQSIDIWPYNLSLSTMTELIPQFPYVGGFWGFPEERNVWLEMPALQVIVEAQMQAGKVAEAMQAVRSVEAKHYVDRSWEESRRANVFAVVMQHLASAGRVSEGLRLALELGDPLMLDNPFVLDSFARDTTSGGDGITLALDYSSQPYPRQPEMRAAPQGKVDAEAVAVARSFPAERRAAALHLVAEVLARAGEPVRGAEAAQLIDEPRHRIGALLAVALAQARAGLRASAEASFGEAVQIAQSFGEDFAIPRTVEHGVRGTVLAYIATVQARASMTAEALQTAGLAGEKGYDAKAVLDLVLGLAEGGRIDEAIRTAGRLGYPAEPSRILANAAVKLSRVGHGAAALEVAGAIAHYPMRVGALAAIARARRQAGADSDAATATRSVMSAVVAASNYYEIIGGLVALSRGLPD